MLGLEKFGLKCLSPTNHRLGRKPHINPQERKKKVMATTDTSQDGEEIVAAETERNS